MSAWDDPFETLKSWTGSVSSQNTCYACTDAYEPADRQHEAGFSPCAWGNFDTQGRIIKTIFKGWALKLLESQEPLPQTSCLARECLNHWAAVGQRHNVPVLEQPGLQHAGLERCLQTRWGGSTFPDTHRSLTKPEESLHQNHFGQHGRYQGVPGTGMSRVFSGC